MGAILPFVSAGAFEPNDIQAMSLAYALELLGKAALAKIHPRA